VIAVPLSFLITFNYIPMLGAQIAFRNYNPIQGIWHSPWTGWKQFDYFFSSPYFRPIIKNTLRISIYSLIMGTISAILLAVALNEVKNGRFKRTVQMVTYAPYFISTVVLVGMMDIILSPTAGLYGQTAHFFGTDTPPDIMGSPAAFPSLYVWSGVWQETGYGAVLYLAALSGVNPEWYEAARMDGASRLQKITHIDLPAIQPTIIVLFILSIGGLLGVGFEKVFLLQNLLNQSTSEIISTYVYKVGLVDSNYSFSVAVGLFNSIIGFVLIMISNLMAKRLTDSSLF
jgi:putative aldouronate transport system permease protein